MSTIKVDTIQTAAGGTPTLADLSISTAGVGKVLQVVSVPMTAKFSTTSSSYVAVTGLTAAITPSSTSSKILILIKTSGSSASGTNAGGAFRLYRNGSALSGALGDAEGSRTTAFAQSASGTSSAWFVGDKSLTYLDSPSSVAEQTYAVYLRSQDASGSVVNAGYDDTDNSDRVRLISTITLMEIAG